MSVSEIHIKDVRNIQNINIQPSAKLNIIVGPNGSGKTTLLEAIYLLGRARSFRTQNIKKIITHEADHLIVYAKLDSPNGISNKIAIKKDQNDTTIRVNGKTEKRASELSRYLHTHLIRPESQTLLERGSSARRSFIDWGVFHVKHEFLDASKKYTQLLKQRNKLLKSKQLDTLHVWNKKFAEYGIIVSKERALYVYHLEKELKQIAKLLIGTEDIVVDYVKGWEQALSLGDALIKNRARDVQYGFTTVGAHKSDIRVLIEDKKAQDFLSRGQMKLLVISLYLAQIKIMSAQKDKSVCVLLDDLAAELDRDNFKKVMSFVVSLGIQVFITTTQENLFLDFMELNESRVFHVEHGCIQKGET
ncbi:MAG: DNA replication/repair protein RecF [Cycloclasticus sp.]|nr:MAG: DNA replication/repair protein RecF [Cycloclasticus sp.]